MINMSMHVELLSRILKWLAPNQYSETQIMQFRWFNPGTCVPRRALEIGVVPFDRGELPHLNGLRKVLIFQSVCLVSKQAKADDEERISLNINVRG